MTLFSNSEIVNVIDSLKVNYEAPNVSLPKMTARCACPRQPLLE